MHVSLRNKLLLASGNSIKSRNMRNIQFNADNFNNAFRSVVGMLSTHAIRILMRFRYNGMQPWKAFTLCHKQIVSIATGDCVKEIAIPKINCITFY